MPSKSSPAQVPATRFSSASGVNPAPVIPDASPKKVLAVTDEPTETFLVLRVPVAVKEGETYHLEVSRQDPTHINCKTKEAWKELLKKYGFTNFVNLNLLTIYDTDGVWSVICLKD